MSISAEDLKLGTKEALRDPVYLECWTVPAPSNELLDKTFLIIIIITLFCLLYFLRQNKQCFIP